MSDDFNSTFSSPIDHSYFTWNTKRKKKLQTNQPIPTNRFHLTVTIISINSLKFPLHSITHSQLVPICFMLTIVKAFHFFFFFWFGFWFDAWLITQNVFSTCWFVEICYNSSLSLDAIATSQYNNKIFISDWQVWLIWRI